MSISRISDLPGNTTGSRYRRRLVLPFKTLAQSPVEYPVIVAIGLALVLALTASGAGGTNWPLATLAIALLLGGVTAHAVVSVNVRAVKREASAFEQRLSAEASASRVLAGIRLLAPAESGGEPTSADSRLAAAARMATGYQAAIVFNLRDAHGVFVPSTRGLTTGGLGTTSWANSAHEDQPTLTGDEFEPVDGHTPGAMAARRGAAVVMSSSGPGSTDLPVWAEQAGFVQGIVTPISRGFDTVGIVYVFNKSTASPTLNEIEQLELIVSFVSKLSRPSGMIRTGTAPALAGSGSTGQPFRVKDSRAEQRTSISAGISMPGFVLNPELERMELDGVSLSLSPTEFQLVNALASSPGRPVSPDELVNSCWDPDARPADNALDVAIFRLRRKLRKTASGKSLIKTVRGSGYMFVPPAPEGAAPVLAD